MAMKTERNAPNQKNSVKTIRDKLFDLTETCNLERQGKRKKNSTLLPRKMRKIMRERKKIAKLRQR